MFIVQHFLICLIVMFGSFWPGVLESGKFLRRLSGMELLAKMSFSYGLLAGDIG